MILSFMYNFLDIHFAVVDGQFVISMLCGRVRTNKQMVFVIYLLDCSRHSHSELHHCVYYTQEIDFLSDVHARVCCV